MKIVLTLSLILLALTPPDLLSQSMTVAAQRDINISRKVINDKRNQTLAFNMSFTQQEKTDFWPLYREYRAAMAEVGDRQLAVIVDYADHYENIGEAKARQLLDDSFAAEKEMLKVKQKYVRKFRKILSEIKVTRLMQIENRIDAAVQMKLAEGIPLIE